MMQVKFYLENFYWAPSLKISPISAVALTQRRRGENLPYLKTGSNELNLLNKSTHAERKLSESNRMSPSLLENEAATAQ